MSIALTRAAGLQLGALLRTVAASQVNGPFFECSIGLFIAGPGLSPNMVLADFTAAGFTGYLAKTAQTFGAAYLDQTNKLQLTSPIQQFLVTADGTPSVILGYYLWQEGTPDVLLAADYFDTAITLTNAGDGVAFAITLEFSLLDHGSYQFAP